MVTEIVTVMVMALVMGRLMPMMAMMKVTQMMAMMKLEWMDMWMEY